MGNIKTYSQFNESTDNDFKLSYEDFYKIRRTFGPISRENDDFLKNIVKEYGFKINRYGDLSSPYYQIIKDENGFGKNKIHTSGIINIGLDDFYMELDDKVKLHNTEETYTHYYKFKHVNDLHKILSKFQ